MPINPYGETKLKCEELLEKYRDTHGINYIALRYFNAAGADPTSELREEHEPETHLIPLLLKAAKENKPFSLFGNDYKTPDGTCIRDYIHVTDLASAHIKSLEYLINNQRSQCLNLGTGKGYSVREVLEAAKKITSKKINEVISERREGDPDSLVAKADAAQKILDWHPQQSDLHHIIRTAWQ